jgi:RimJ/RimL family protein N-acetyltransferase
MRTVRTDRLILEPLQEAHAAEMFRVLVDPIIYTFLRERPPFTEDELRARHRFLERRRSPDGTHDWFSWVVRDTGGEMFGYVLAMIHAPGTADLAVVLAPRRWRQGYAREAVGAVMRELAQTRKIATFFATISPRNDPAIRLFQALGYKLASRGDFDMPALDDGDLIFAVERVTSSWA